jgi:hypothetical protein
MAKIPPLYDGIKFNTIPKIIYNELISNSNDRSFTSFRDDNGEYKTIYGELNPPLFMTFGDEFNFYLNYRHYESFINRIRTGKCYDEYYNKVTEVNFCDYLKPYNNGFIKGYNEFENNIKNGNNLFNPTNEQIAHKIYSRVLPNTILKRDGYFKLYSDGLKNEIETKICNENNISYIVKITEKNFFESGIEGGEFYKAWELILNNPTVFEPIFLKNINTNVEDDKTEIPPIDLSDTTATEKIIYLQKLGVIDFLRTKQPFQSSTNSLAIVLSAITGEKLETIQPMLNPIVSKEAGQKNNPLNSKKAVPKVEQQLIKIGFNLNETI